MAIPNVKTRTSHSLAIRVNGVTVGLVQSWGYDLTRDVTPVYELNPLTSGVPVDNVPGNEKGLNISVSRVDLYSKKLEQAFGTPDLEMLTDQSNPFLLHEVWLNPDGTTDRWVYEGCWFSSIRRKIDVSGNRIVVAEGTIAYLKRRRG